MAGEHVEKGAGKWQWREHMVGMLVVVFDFFVDAAKIVYIW